MGSSVLDLTCCAVSGFWVSDELARLPCTCIITLSAMDSGITLLTSLLTSAYPAQPYLDPNVDCILGVCRSASHT